MTLFCRIATALLASTLLLSVSVAWAVEPQPARSGDSASPLAQASVPGARPGAYPVRAVRWIIPYPAGASNDVVARLLAQKLTQIWDQPVVVENRSGAGGTIGANLVAKAEPDGYTLLMANPGSNVTNFALGIETPYAARDFAHVVLLGWAPIMLSVNGNFPARTLAELVAMAKAEPGILTGGSSGTGGSSPKQISSRRRSWNRKTKIDPGGAAATGARAANIVLSFSLVISVVKIVPISCI